MEDQFTYDFNDQLPLGQKGEERVFAYLNNLPETISLRNVAMDKKFQALGIDGFWDWISPVNELVYSTSFDVKTDFYVHKRDTLYLETHKADGVLGGFLSTKAELFLYYDPYKGRLIHIPIARLRNWYYKKGLAMKHIQQAQGVGRYHEGLVLTLAQLEDICFELKIQTDIEPLKFV